MVTTSKPRARGPLGKALAAGTVLAAIGLTSSYAVAMQNEPTGFMGIAWGAPIENYKGAFTTLSEDETGGNYRRASDQLTFAGVDARRISYRFYKSKFSSGMVLTVGTTALKNVLATLTERHGEPEESNPRHRIYTWTGNRVGITVSCDISMGCYTEYYDRALRQEEIAQGGEPGPRTEDDD